MQVRVRPLRKRGILITREELKVRPAHIGRLKVCETRDPALMRPVVRARLLDAATGTEVDVLPELNDARLLWVDNGQLRLLGTERQENAEFSQTWDVEQMPC